MHSYKIGDWFELGILRYLVFRVEPTCYWGVAKNGCIALCKHNDTGPKHLPDCTDWDWQPTPREWWVNIYAAGDVVFHKTKEQADKTAGSARTACIRVREVIE
jgi:hypothetical protein